jgi:hypothetical protein
VLDHLCWKVFVTLFIRLQNCFHLSGRWRLQSQANSILRNASIGPVLAKEPRGARNGNNIDSIAVAQGLQEARHVANPRCFGNIEEVDVIKHDNWVLPHFLTLTFGLQRINELIQQFEFLINKLRTSQLFAFMGFANIAEVNVVDKLPFALQLVEHMQNRGGFPGPCKPYFKPSVPSKIKNLLIFWVNKKAMLASVALFPAQYSVGLAGAHFNLNSRISSSFLLCSAFCCLFSFQRY